MEICTEKIQTFSFVELICCQVCAYMVDCVSPHQYTPLHWAAVSGHIDTVQCLIKEGAEINIRDNRGKVSDGDCNAN